MDHTDKKSQHNSIIWPVWLNGWVFVYELSDCGFESHCCHLKFGKDLPHELLLTTRQKAKLRNAFNNNMSTDLKLSKAQISK